LGAVRIDECSLPIHHLRFTHTLSLPLSLSEKEEEEKEEVEEEEEAEQQEEAEEEAEEGLESAWFQPLRAYTMKKWFTKCAFTFNVFVCRYSPVAQMFAGIVYTPMDVVKVGGEGGKVAPTLHPS
jgi:ribosome-binding ATPase YchF (GTP1/OBG family)